ncbi:hypothetical protein C1646_752006 [Rhizophagus diaphanus]|nr:hypothetical protein C1646_752006 [Rhizophagus diaphanus] [Rhizophagus sp. MUCL 43196]
MASLEIGSNLDIRIPQKELVPKLHTETYRESVITNPIGNRESVITNPIENSSEENGSEVGYRIPKENSSDLDIRSQEISFENCFQNFNKKRISSEVDTESNSTDIYTDSNRELALRKILQPGYQIPDKVSKV